MIHNRDDDEEFIPVASTVFDGVDDRVTQLIPPLFGNWEDIDASRDKTYIGWVKHKNLFAVGGGDEFFSHFDPKKRIGSNVGQGIRCFTNNNFVNVSNFIIVIQTDNTLQHQVAILDMAANTDIINDEWFQYAITYDADGFSATKPLFKIYLNGVFNTAQTTVTNAFLNTDDASTANDGWIFGMVSLDETEVPPLLGTPMKGNMFDFKIFNYVMNSEEIWHEYNNGNPNDCTGEFQDEGLQTYIVFDGMGGATGTSTDFVFSEDQGQLEDLDGIEQFLVPIGPVLGDDEDTPGDTG